MIRKCLFADATSEAADADFVLVGLPIDSTTSYRSGARDGPDAVRLASWSFETYNHRCGIDLQDLRICDLGDAELGTDPAFAAEEIKSSFSEIPEGSIPIFLGGEHSILPPIVERMAEDRKLGVIVLDAHLDLRDEYGCTKLSHACASRRVLETKGLGGYASIGIRSGSKEEFAYASRNWVNFRTSDEVKELGMDRVLDSVLERMDCDYVYLSIDLDVLDPSYAPAVGNPEPFGLSPWDVRRAIDRLAPKVVGMDINEIAPAYDSGQTAVLGSGIVREFIASKARCSK